MGSISQFQPHMEPKHPNPEFYPVTVTEESKAYHRKRRNEERREAIKRVPELRSLLFRQALDRRVDCHDALDQVVETFGVETVWRCMRDVLAANNIDIATRTINDVAQGEEQQ
jgi:hypothetical protein